MNNSNTGELIAKLKEVLEIDKPLRSLKIEWEQGGPVSVTTETMISDKWTVDIEPVFEANHKLKGLLPEACGQQFSSEKPTKERV